MARTRLPSRPTSKVAVTVGVDVGKFYRDQFAADNEQCSADLQTVGDGLDFEHLSADIIAAICGKFGNVTWDFE